MGRLIETVGRYAECPYYMAQTDTSVYCVEELCFALCRNAFLLDRGILDMRLAKWLDEECGLKELARQLYPLINQNGSPGAFVGIILEYAHFGSEKKRRETEELLRAGADMDASARRKHFADYLVENRRYAQAITEYDKMLEETPSANHVMRSQLLHNKGVAFCRLFCFADAAEAFFAAYQENPEHEEHILHYLAALRMSLSKEDYIAFIADHPSWHEQSLEVEERMGKSTKDFEDSEAFGNMKKCFARHDAEYYETVSGKLTEMRKKYREMVAQP